LEKPNNGKSQYYQSFPIYNTRKISEDDVVEKRIVVTTMMLAAACEQDPEKDPV
jgi:hypothetical protein